MTRTARLERLAFFIEDSMNAAVMLLDQQILFRWCVGGIWIRMNNKWSEAFVALIGDDGSRYFFQRTADGAGNSFHETNSAIERIQEF